MVDLRSAWFPLRQISDIPCKNKLGSAAPVAVINCGSHLGLIEQQSDIMK